MSFLPVMGLDLSLSATGICVAMRPGVYLLDHVGESLTREQSRDPVIEIDRWDKIVMRILKRALIGDVKHVVLEAPAYGGYPNDQLAEFRGAVKWALWKSPASPIESLVWVHSGTARKAVLGNGAMKKPEVTAKVRELTGRETATHDECDAFVVAEWLCRKLNGRGIL